MFGARLLEYRDLTIGIRARASLARAAPTLRARQ
jgi:hypothetical protein